MRTIPSGTIGSGSGSGSGIVSGSIVSVSDETTVYFKLRSPSVHVSFKSNSPIGNGPEITVFIPEESTVPTFT